MSKPGLTTNLETPDFIASARKAVDEVLATYSELSPIRTLLILAYLRGYETAVIDAERAANAVKAAA